MKTNDNNQVVKITKFGTVADAIIALLAKDTGNGFRASNKEIADHIKSCNPTLKTSPACVAWYASKMQDAGFAKKHGHDKWTPLKTVRSTKVVEIKI